MKMTDADRDALMTTTLVSGRDSVRAYVQMAALYDREHGGKRIGDLQAAFDELGVMGGRLPEDVFPRMWERITAARHLARVVLAGCSIDAVTEVTAVMDEMADSWEGQVLALTTMALARVFGEEMPSSSAETAGLSDVIARLVSGKKSA